MEFMTQKEAAAYLKVCRQTLSKLNAPSHSVPGTNRRRYLKSELIDWIRAYSEPATGLHVILH